MNNAVSFPEVKPSNYSWAWAWYDETSCREPSANEMCETVQQALHTEAPLKIFYKILDSNPDMDENARGSYVAHAAKRGRYDVVDLLLSHGQCSSNQLDNALVNAAKYGEITTLVSILQTRGNSIEGMKRAIPVAAKKFGLPRDQGMIKALLQNALERTNKEYYTAEAIVNTLFKRNNETKYEDDIAIENENEALETVHNVIENSGRTRKLREALSVCAGRMSANERAILVKKAAKTGSSDKVDLLLRDGPCEQVWLESALVAAADYGYIRPVISIVLSEGISARAMNDAAEKAAKFSDGMIVTLLKYASAHAKVV